MHQICQGDCELWLPQLDPKQSIKCLFVDPPDNLGMDYGEVLDNLPDADYIELLDRWLHLFVAKADTVWISFNAKWLLHLGRIVLGLLEKYEKLKWKPCVQTFTFYQHCKTDFGNAHRPLWRLSHEGSFYPDQVRIPSWRQLHGDKRANPEGKIPGDHFDFPRVTGNSKQRRSWHPTQLHEELVERVIKSCTKEGDLVLDPCAGTGTTLRVCRRINRNCILIEKNPAYCEEIAKEHGAKLREKGKYSRWVIDD